MFNWLERHGDQGGSERPSSIVRFSKEQKNGLARLGYEYFYTLYPLTLEDLRVSGHKFFSTWSKDDAFENVTSMNTEVALNPSALFLAKSNHKEYEEQLAMIANFSKALGREVPGTKAVMGDPSDYLSLAFAHVKAMGDRLFGSDYYYNYTRTASTSGSVGAVVGSFRDDELGMRLTTMPLEVPDADLFVTPLIVPQKAR